MTNIALPDTTWAIPSGRALLLRTQSLGLFAVPVSIAIALAGCQQPTQRELENRALIEKAEATSRLYDDAFDHCIYRTTGPFASASIDVIHYCEGQARLKSGLLQ